MRTLSFALVSLSLAWLLAVPARAQGLGDAQTGTLVMTPQTAAVDDAFALYVNPAGLAFVDILQLVAGYQGRVGGTPRDMLTAGIATSPFEGFALGGSATAVILPTGFGTSFSRFTGGAAFRIDRFLSFGASLNRLQAGDAQPVFLTDVGLQVRPFGWLALGGSLEGLGADFPYRTSARTGISTRPFGEWLTLGVDTRFVAGSEDLLSPAAYTEGQIVPGVNALLRFGGLALSAGAVWRNLGQPGPADVQIGVGLQVDTRHFGAALLGGYATSEQVHGAVLGRASVERFLTIFPFGGAWISLTLTGEGVPERDPITVFEELLAPPVHPAAVISALERAARDPEVEGVVLRLRSLSLGWGRMAELRQALLALREAGRKVVVYLESGDDAAVYLASAADRVYLSPAGGLDLNGLQLTLTYFADGLERLGVRATAVVAGDFKSAPRAFTATEPNENERIVTGDLLDAFFGALVSGIAEGRSLSEEEVVEIIHLGGLSAKQALEKGIVDGLFYFDQIPEAIEDLAGRRPFLDTGYLEQFRRTTRWESPKRIAIVPIVGTIQMGRAGGGLDLFGDVAAAEDIIDALDAARTDPDVAAVVLRIDSPGGDALASDLIWHAVMRLREQKPVIASMGDIAASGGYYVASGAQEIYAEPTTLTGSIGVYTLLFTGRELMRDLGIHAFEFQRGERPGPSFFRPPTEEERERYQVLVNETYERFLEAVLLGRKMDEAALRKAAEGRVWTGAAAHERGLVDALGGLPAALDRARALAGIPSPNESEIAILTGREEIFPRLRTAVQALVGTHPAEAQVKAVARLLLGDPASLQLITEEGRPLALTPVRVRVR